MKHQKSPYNYKKREGEASFVASNPLCGDTFQVYLDQNANQIEKAHFHGFGCALSKASTSMLMEAIEGREADEIREFCKDFLEAADGKKKLNVSREIDMLAELRNHGGRMDCIKLSWKSLYEYLEGENS